MRIAIALTATLASTFAWASPQGDTLDLYSAIVRQAPVIFDALGMRGDPALAASQAEDARRTVDRALQAWMDHAFARGASAHYRPFSGCLEAATALQDVTNAGIRVLRARSTATDMHSAADVFKAKLSACETTLGLPVSFD
jgi:hypothetical protein